MMCAIVVFQNQLGQEKRICHSGQLLFFALVMAVWSICLICDWPTKSSKESGLVKSMVSFCIVVSIFLISIYEINEYKLSLSYYFFVKMQEKDFFDRMKTTNKRLNLCFIAIHHSMRALRPKNPENITNFPGSFASAQNDSNEQKIPSPINRGIPFE